MEHVDALVLGGGAAGLFCGGRIAKRGQSVLVPVFFAFVIGFAMFTRRVGGVYFAIITQAFAAILTILIIGQQGYTGGVNGITDQIGRAHV